jgi:hypothetical protein
MAKNVRCSTEDKRGKELAESPFANGDKIDVTLEGTVPNERSLEDAVESAREAGARKVISKLKTRKNKERGEWLRGRHPFRPA